VAVKVSGTFLLPAKEHHSDCALAPRQSCPEFSLDALRQNFGWSPRFLAWKIHDLEARKASPWYKTVVCAGLRPKVRPSLDRTYHNRVFALPRYFLSGR